MRYFKNTSWMFAEQALKMIAGLFVGIWVARYLGPEQFGIFSYATAFVAIFAGIAKLGLDSIVVRELVNHPEKASVYMGTAFWLKVLGAVLVWAIIGATTLLSNNDHSTKIYILIIASGIIFQSFEVIDFYFQSLVLAKFVTICKITQLLLSSVLKIYFVLTGADLIWFIIVSLIDQAAVALGLYLLSKLKKQDSFHREFDLKIAKQLLRFSLPLVISSLSVSIYMRIDQMIIQSILGAKSVGMFSVAVNISEALYFVPLLITKSLFPSIINAKKNDFSLYSSRLRRLNLIIFYLSLLICFIVSFFADNIMTLLYGNTYSGAGVVLSVHIWAFIFVGLGLVNWQWFLIENLQNIATINTVFGAIINILLNFTLIPIYGIKGAALATLFSYAFSVYFILIFFKKTRQRFFDITISIVTITNLKIHKKELPNEK